MLNNSETRSQFEEKIEPIIGINPQDLSKYFEKRCKNLSDCSKCGESLFVKESGLTKENISILLKSIRDLVGGLYDHCVGTENDELVFCYERKLIPTTTKIQKEIFYSIETVSYVLRNYGLYESRYKKVYEKKREELRRIFNEIEHGVLSLNKSFKRTKLENTTDMLNTKTWEGDIVHLHGHQLKRFIRGERPEQKLPVKYKNESIGFIHLGHFHRLGVISVDNFPGIVSLGGTFLLPYKTGYHPEMLSHIGLVGYKVRDKKTKLTVRRNMINESEMEETVQSNIQNPRSLEDRINNFREDCKKFEILIPGNHDLFEEIYCKKGCGFREGITCLIHLGDSVEFSESEKSDSRRIIGQILEEEQFIPISKYNEQFTLGIS